MVQVAVTDLSTYIDGKGHLNPIEESSKTGWRFSTSTAANYGDIGTEAVDLSFSDATSSTRGATGDYSTAMGSNTTASGYYTTAMGHYTTASDYGSLVMGKYNSVGSSVTSGGSANAFDTDNSAFVIGNGTASGSESDALVVYSSGNATLGGDLTISGSLDVTGSMNLGVNSTITSSTTFNGTATVIPVNASSGNITVTIDTDQKVAGRILIIKQLGGGDDSVLIATEGSEQIQGGTSSLANTYQIASDYVSVQLFCDGSNWYDLSAN